MRMKEDMLQVKHDCNQYNASLGITNERAKELTILLVKTSLDSGKVSSVIDKIWNSSDFTFEEKVLMTFKAGAFSTDTKAQMGAIIRRKEGDL